MDTILYYLALSLHNSVCLQAVSRQIHSISNMHINLPTITRNICFHCQSDVTRAYTTLLSTVSLSGYDPLYHGYVCVERIKDNIVSNELKITSHI